MNTWTDIRNAFYDVIGDPQRALVPVATAERWANLGLYDLCEAALYNDTAATQNVVASTALYSISDDVYEIFRVEYDDEVLTPITNDDLARDGRDYQYRTGKPRFYTLDEMYTETASPDKVYVRLWETPSSNLTNGLRVWYHGYPDDVDNDSPGTDIDVPDWAVGAVLFYMLARAYESQYSVGMQNFDTAAFYAMMYEDIRDRLVIRSRERVPKRWVAGASAGPSANVMNRLPDRVPAP